MTAPQKSNEPVMRVERELRSNTPDDSGRDRIKQFVKVSARVIGVCAAGFVLLARDGIGPPYLDSVGKALFWTGIVLVPLFSFNHDVLRTTSGQVVAVGLSTLQFVLVFYSFERLQECTFIVLTPLCLIQCLIFFLPFMLIRKRHNGIWY